MRRGVGLPAKACRSFSTAQPNRFLQKLDAGETIICGEGYLFELERRGWVQVGPFVPEVVLSDPEVVKGLHREFLRAGSDVIEAFTYYGHREKLRLIGKEHLLEPLNRGALELAKEVAAEGDAMVAGNICNTTVWVDNDPESHAEARRQFDEQCQWAAEAGVDFIIGETYDFTGEALAALAAIQAVGLPSVITMAFPNKQFLTRDGHTPSESCQIVKDAGATVVGLNCAMGPGTMVSHLRDVRRDVDGPLAALPVAYRTTPEKPHFQALSQQGSTYTDLDPFVCTRYDFSDFTKDCMDIGIQYIGTCCGGAPHHIRAMAEALGRTPPASAYSPDLSKHYYLGDPEKHKLLRKQNTNYSDTFDGTKKAQ